MTEENNEFESETVENVLEASTEKAVPRPEFKRSRKSGYFEEQVDVWVDSALAVIDNLVTDRQAIYEKSQTRKARIASLEEQIERLGNSANPDTLNDAEAKIEELTAEVTALQVELAEERAALKGHDISETIGERDARIAELEAKLAASADSVEAPDYLVDEINAKNNQIMELQARVATLESAGLVESSTDPVDSASELLRKASEIAARFIEDAEKEVSEMKAKLISGVSENQHQIVEELESARKEIAEAEATKAAISEEIDVLKNEMSIVRTAADAAAIQAKNNELAELEGDIAIARQKRDSLVSEHSDVAAKLAAFYSQQLSSLKEVEGIKVETIVSYTMPAVAASTTEEIVYDDEVEEAEESFDNETPRFLSDDVEENVDTEEFALAAGVSEDDITPMVLDDEEAKPEKKKFSLFKKRSK